VIPVIDHVFDFEKQKQKRLKPEINFFSKKRIPVAGSLSKAGTRDQP